VGSMWGGGIMGAGGIGAQERGSRRFVKLLVEGFIGCIWRVVFCFGGNVGGFYVSFPVGVFFLLSLGSSRTPARSPAPCHRLVVRRGWQSLTGGWVCPEVVSVGPVLTRPVPGSTLRHRRGDNMQDHWDLGPLVAPNRSRFGPGSRLVDMALD